MCSSDLSETEQKWTTGGGWLREKSYITQTTTITGLQNYYSYAMKADWPIQVGFLQGGKAPGAITINSVGSVVLSGGLTAATDLSVSASGGAINAPVLQFGDGAALAFSAANDISLGLGSTAAGATLGLSAQAGGDLTVGMVNGSNGTPTLQIKAGSGGAPALSAGGTLLLTSSAGVDLSLQPAGSAPFISANLLQISLGSGNLGSAANPLSIASGGTGTQGGVAVQLAGTGSIGLSQATGDLALVLPTGFSGANAISTGGDVSLTVGAGRLLDATGLVVNPLNETALAAQDAAFSITGQAALNAAYQEMANQDASDYYNYWIQYRNATQNPDGTWTADPDPFAGGGTFVFTDAQVQQLTNEGWVSSAISTYQNALATVEQQTGAGMYDPNFVYQRPQAQQQAYISQRVIGTNTYYYPLDQIGRAHV